MIFCDEKYVPACEVLGYNNHVQTAGRIHEQAAWQHEAKARVWSIIAAQKIRMQEQVMFQCVPDQAVSLQSYVESMSCGDASNCEAQAAKVYFHRMFGRTFVRSQETTVNAALNYGYAVLRSEISRILAAHGYHSALGIHHCSRVNPYNLSCDLMEPFRPVVDALVFRCRGMDFDFEMKKQLIALPYQRIGYGDEIYSLSDAADIFCLDCFRCLKDSTAGIKELRIVEP